MTSLYQSVGGMAGTRRLASVWHELVLADELLAHAFSHGFAADHIERLAAYWAEVFGGPNEYTTKYGSESHVVRLHSGNGSHDEMTRRATELFDEAVITCGWRLTDPVGRSLANYFRWAATSQVNQFPLSADDVPVNLTIPKWSIDSDGLEFEKE